MLGEVALGLEAEVAILAGVGPDVGVRADVFFQHGGFLAADAARVADVFAAPPAAYVGVVVVGGLVSALYRSPRPLPVLLKCQTINCEIFLFYF